MSTTDVLVPDSLEVMADRDERKDYTRELVASGALDKVFDSIDSGELQLTGEGGFILSMIKAVLERALQAELSSHLGYEKNEAAGLGSGNSRNGTSPRTLITEAGPVPLDVPRDRKGTFAPCLVPKGMRRTGGLDDMIISLYAGGMTIRDIQQHLEATYGTELSHETISNITDQVLDEVRAWQDRPLDAFYPVMYLDAISVKIKDGGKVVNKAAHIALGVDMDGIKHVLGIWVQPNEESAVKLLWLAIINIEEKRAREREKEKGRKRGENRKAKGYLMEGQMTTNWKQALTQLAVAFPDRMEPHL